MGFHGLLVVSADYIAIASGKLSLLFISPARISRRILSASPQSNAKSLLRKELGFTDVLLFNIATVLGPRWVAAAAHSGQSSISLWVLASLFFFVPTALVIVELSTRFPTEGGLYIWAKEAFGDFHGFLAGWCYWIYTIFYFPGLLLASVAMSVYVAGPRYAWVANNVSYQVGASLVLLAIAVGFNIVGLNIGKWLQNAGGVGTYVPLVMLVGLAVAVWFKQGSVTHFSAHAMLPEIKMDTLNFWSQIAFAFTGLELVCTMSEEVKDPRRTIPRAILLSGVLVAAIYILGTLGVLIMMPTDTVDPRNGVFQALGSGSQLMGIAWFGMLAAMLVSVGNAGGVGSTVAGIARIPFVAGIDHYLPAAFGKIHPRWRTPHVSILVQAGLSAAVLLLFQFNESIRGAYQALVDAAIILYFVPFLYMYAGAIRLAYKRDRQENPAAILIPGGKSGVWLVAGLAFAVTFLAILFSVIPTADVADPRGFELKVVGSTAVCIAIGLALYWRGARAKKQIG
jgi:amino acid transporter